MSAVWWEATFSTSKSILDYSILDCSILDSPSGFHHVLTVVTAGMTIGAPSKAKLQKPKKADKGVHVSLRVLGGL